MKFETASRFVALTLIAVFLAGCQGAASTPSAAINTSITSTASPASDSSLFLTQYVFPASIDPTQRYMFYLHGKIIEDQGIPAVSPDYGIYEYETILEKLASHGFTIISEQRTKNMDGMKYAERVAGQVTELLNAGVPPKNITVVGASKGAAITVFVSHLLKNTEMNFVLLGTCHPDAVEEWKRNQIFLYGNILTIYDFTDDEYSGSCEELFTLSEGIGRHDEIVLHVGAGHGILYKPLDEWILPAVNWAVGGLLSEEDLTTLASLEQVDEHPLYTMHYYGTYPGRARFFGPPVLSQPTPVSAQTSCDITWGCSLFAALGDEADRLFGRNFDWHFSPALLLFTDPADGYASVSMVDIEYLGFEEERSKNITDLSLEERRALLNAPSLPFDGMNEKGLAIGMAAVPAEDMPYDPQKKTLDELEVIREVLDHAGTVDKAIEIMGSFNIDMGSVPIHYMIASASGGSAVVEFYNGRMVVFRNEERWQTATNFLLASVEPCWRYDLIEQRLNELDGRASSIDAINLLEDVSQDHTQWSIVYHMTTGELEVVMGRDYSEIIHTFQLEQSAR
jgi:hypothetical protein